MTYSAGAGTTAAERPVQFGASGPLGAALELSALFRRVRAQVLEATDGEQRPREYASLLSEHYLSGPSGAAPRLQQETVGWRRGSTPVDATNRVLVERPGAPVRRRRHVEYRQ